MSVSATDEVVKACGWYIQQKFFEQNKVAWGPIIDKRNLRLVGYRLSLRTLIDMYNKQSAYLLDHVVNSLLHSLMESKAYRVIEDSFRWGYDHTNTFMNVAVHAECEPGLNMTMGPGGIFFEEEEYEFTRI